LLFLRNNDNVWTDTGLSIPSLLAYLLVEPDDVQAKKYAPPCIVKSPPPFSPYLVKSICVSGGKKK
jgi:hypothetical protein